MAQQGTQRPPQEHNGGEPHVMFIPSAGMGHLLPFFRVIAALSGHGVDISVVTVLPTVSAAEADHFAELFAAFPHVRRVDFHLLPFDAAEFPGHDPFLLRWEALRRSVHLLGPLVAGAAPRVLAVVTDVTLASDVIPICKELRVPCHVLFISCATMLSLVAYLPVHLDKKKAGTTADGDVGIPGVRRISQSWLPQPLLDLEKLFTKQFIDNGRAIVEADGFLVNTFEALEPVTLAALRDGKVVPAFPPLYAIGPLKSHSSTETDDAKGKPTTGMSSPVAWLDAQPARSVVYVAFGNRNAVSLDQIREIAAGLEASGYRFLWVLKTTTVDRDDAAELADVLGDGFYEDDCLFQRTLK
jgi:2-hydroxyflavanone C-glucosyltransferase